MLALYMVGGYNYTRFVYSWWNSDNDNGIEHCDMGLLWGP